MMKRLDVQRVMVLSCCFLMSTILLNGSEPVEIRGRVVDPSGAAVKDALVIFESSKGQASTVTSARGTYSMQLAPGVYEIRVASGGFCRMRRSLLSVEHRSLMGIDFYVVLCHTDTGAVEYTEEELTVPGSSERKAILQFGKREESPVPLYTGVSQQRWYVQPVLTFDRWTLRANTIKYDRGTNTLYADGAVSWQDGMSTTNAEYLQVSLQNPPRVLKIEH